jgi:hypothetical protein
MASVSRATNPDGYLDCDKKLTKYLRRRCDPDHSARIYGEILRHRRFQHWTFNQIVDVVQTARRQRTPRYVITFWYMDATQMGVVLDVGISLSPECQRNRRGV